ncbi:LL-diaminopimelate aminotransferase [Treponema sp.]|uniref:LL-diaminopimelate aminotransferase n=1 Tax=Treponema sp. TaxID=166 RepID=UPI0025D92C94|nr:LL-diaminopimelate aminotransferase [Treponema sp.]MCR5218804.1 LL-diaminopimelate aminotransferase [Treponema sp.]
MIERNKGFANLAAGYLFPEVAKRRREYQAKHPDAKIISLGIGNTTEPLTPHIAKAMADYAKSLGTAKGYSGYGDEQGNTELRSKIAEVLYPKMAKADEVFISDGAKCDIARIQTLFGRNVKIAVQDPAYPVYVDGSVVVGAAGASSKKGYKGVTYLPCTAENKFFPELEKIPADSLIYFCSPNNPTGACASKAQLKKLVDYANKNGCIIIFDAAYYAFIRDDKLPRTIYEIPGARKCAIEINSFSKLAGFTGVRLGWSVVPSDIKFADGTPVKQDWNRVMTTLFNGASNIAQAGGLAALDKEGQKETKELVDYYLENAKLMEEALTGDNFKKAGVKVYYTGDSPYLWVNFPGWKSWDIFDKILDECNVVTTPGSGFGPAGESYLRFSSFGHRKDVKEACKRLSKLVL